MKTKNELQEEIMEAVARGWCHPKNGSKTMDVDLALAISEEVLEIWPKHQKTG